MTEQMTTKQKVPRAPVAGTVSKKTSTPEKPPVIALDKPLDAKQILHLQRTIGNQAVRRILKQQNNPTGLELRRRKAIQRRKQAHQDGDIENHDDNQFIVSATSTHQTDTVTLQRTPEDVVLPMNTSLGVSAAPMTVVQRNNNNNPPQQQNQQQQNPPPQQNQQQQNPPQQQNQQPQQNPPQQQNQQQNPPQQQNQQPQQNQPVTPQPQNPPKSKAAKVGKKIGYGLLNFMAGSILGPLTDLKHGIRALHYKVQKDPKAKEKTEKVAKRVKEEWIGDYGNHTWMKVIHGISTTVEKAAGIAGVIALAATIASIWMGAAAPIATIAGLVAVSLSALAFILRAILGFSSLAYKDVGKNMVIANFLNLFGNLLQVVSFGVGTAVSGGLNFKPEVGEIGTVGRDFGIGTSFGFVAQGANTTVDAIQAKRLIQREGDDDGETEDPMGKDLINTMLEADSALPMVRQDAQKDQSDLSSDKGKFAKIGGKFSEMFGQNETVKSQANEMQSAAQNAEQDTEEQPDESAAHGISKKEVEKLEGDINETEQVIDSETAPNISTDKLVKEKQKKKGFFARMKEAFKGAGKAIKKKLSQLGQRALSAFNRFKTMMKKLMLKIAGFVLKALGLDKELAGAKQEFDQDANQQDQYMKDAVNRESQSESLGKQMEPFR